MTRRFVAPARLESLQDVRKALQRIQEQLDSGRATRGALITTDTTLRAGETVRISPRQGATLFAKLPKAGAENFGQQIHVQLERPTGTLKIAAEAPDTVAGLTTASFTLAGLIVVESNGVDSWVLVNQLPINSPASATNYFFSNANNVSFGTLGSTVTASVTVASTQGSIRVLGGTGNVLSSQFSFANSGNVSWTLQTNGVINASVTVASTQASILVSAGTTSVLGSSFRFQNSNAISFGINTNGVVTASAASGLSALGAGTLSVVQGLTGLQFQDTNGVSFQLSTNAGTPGNGFVFASVAPQIGLISHVGGNSVSNVTRLAFSNASNVTWSLSTAVGGATVLASVDTAAGGIAFADTGVTHTSGTILAHSGINVSSLFSLGIGGNSTRNVQLGFAGAGTNLTAQAHMRAHHSTNGAGEMWTRINFLASNGITFGVQSNETGAGAQRVDVTASYNPLAIGAPIAAGASPVSAGTINLSTHTDQRSARRVNAVFSNTSLLFDWTPPYIGAGGYWNEVTGGNVVTVGTQFWRRPYFFQPFRAGQLAIWGKGNEDHRIGDWYLLMSGNSTAGTSNASLFVTAMIGLYSIEGSIGSRLILINSASRSFSNGTDATSFSSRYGGNRWLEFPASAWSNSTGPLTYGEYYAGLMFIMGQSANSTITTGSNDARLAVIGSSGRNVAGNFGLFGQARAAATNDGQFWGLFTATTAALPATVVSSNISANVGQACMLPGISVRANGISAGWPGPT